MTVDGRSSTRAAAKLRLRAGHAFDVGDAEIGRQLLAEAASMYEHAGESEIATELLVERGMIEEAASMAARSGHAARAAELRASLRNQDENPPPLLPGAPAAPSPVSGSQTLATLAPVPVPGMLEEQPTDTVDVRSALSAPPTPLAAPPEVRRAEGMDPRFVGRSPRAVQLEVWDEEFVRARDAEPSAYLEHVRAQIEALDPARPSLRLPAPSPDPMASITSDLELSESGPSFELAFEAPVEADTDAWAERVDAVSDDTPSEGIDTRHALAAIDQAIAANIDPEALDARGGAEPLSIEAIPTAEAPESLEGFVLRGRFRLGRRIGKGAQAQVFLARDQVLDRPLAIKVLDAKLVENPETLEGFLSEARFAAQVHHPSCLSVFDFGREGELTFLAMEYFRGRSLRTLLRGGRLEPYLALHIGRRVAEALAAVHRAGIIHRDVKPSNILVDRSARAKLTDFGVAIKKVDAEPSGLMVGTLRYMPPEQARGRTPDPRSDLFSLGAVVWEMLAGVPCFDPTVAALKARLNAPPQPLPDDVQAPPVVAEALAKCLSPRPEGRLESAAELATALASGIGQLRRTQSGGRAR